MGGATEVAGADAVVAAVAGVGGAAGARAVARPAVVVSFGGVTEAAVGTAVGGAATPLAGIWMAAAVGDGTGGGAGTGVVVVTDFWRVAVAEPGEGTTVGIEAGILGVVKGGLGIVGIVMVRDGTVVVAT